jgi:hypothetical protein
LGGGGVLDRVRQRPVLAASLLYLILALALFSPAFAPGRTLSAGDSLWAAVPWAAEKPASVPGLGSNQEQQDATVQFYPALHLTRESLPDIPLWDPHMLSGRPFLGDPQGAVFSLFSVPTYVLPFWDSLAFVAALKVFVAALGAFLLARAVGMRYAGSVTTGLVFGFSLWSVTWVSWTLGSVWVLLPWLCLTAELCVRRPGLLPFAGLGAATGVQWLGGHPASSLQILLAVALFWVGRTLASRETRRGWPRRLLVLGAGFAVGTALAAVSLIPFAELLSHSSDATARAEVSTLLKQPARYLLGIFLHDYWGHAETSLQFGPGLEERAYYVAALPLMMAAGALVIRPAAARVAVALTGAFALAAATGLPPAYDIVIALPGFESTNNGRFAVVAVLCLAVLAGWGLDELSAAAPARRRRIVLGVAAALLVLPIAIALADRSFGREAFGEALRVAWGLADAQVGAAAVIKLASVLEWVVLAGAALVLLALRLGGRLKPAVFVAAALALIVFDLFKAGMGYNPAIEERYANPAPTPAVEYLQERAPERFSALAVAEALSLAYPIPPNVAMRYGLYDARGYVIPTEERYFNLWREVIRDGDCYYLFCTQAPPPTPESLRALSVLGVGLLLQHPGDPPLTDLEAVYSGDDARIYRNPDALPRAFLVSGQTVVEGAGAALAAVADPAVRLRETAVVERPIAGLDDRAGSAGEARIGAYESERVVVEADADRPALLVLTDAWYPGWKARVDGREVDVERVDYLVRGVPVPAGSHTVEFSYEPASWRVGWIVSLLALLTIAAAAAVGWRRRQEPRHAAQTDGMFEG